jgi:galactokinase
MNVREQVLERFAREFPGSEPRLVRAPGRVNLIGEHTDYNGGFVLPLAIDRAAWIAFRPRRDTVVRVVSLDFNETREFDLATMRKEDSNWIEYLKGVAHAMQLNKHELCGWEGVMAGDVPVGAGLSSSAALELATARVFAAVSALAWDPVEMALVGQAAENKWVGVNCGIMDQLISSCGAADHALLIDCRSLEAQPVPMPPGTAVVILDTATRRGLESSAYNERRGQCEAAAKFFGVELLRDVSVEQFYSREKELPALTAQRARHVVTENDRTVRAADALRQGDAVVLGQLMDQSHVSLRDDFAVSSSALNAMVEIARKQPGCHGARMTGAGFGGCAVALVAGREAEAFAANVAREYEAVQQLKPNVYVCRASAGAELVSA